MTAPVDDPIIDALDRRGLGAPAELLIDTHRPLAPLMDDAITFLDPILRPLLGTRLRTIRSWLRPTSAPDDRKAGDTTGAG